METCDTDDMSLVRSVKQCVGTDVLSENGLALADGTDVLSQAGPKVEDTEVNSTLRAGSKTVSKTKFIWKFLVVYRQFCHFPIHNK